MGPGCFHPRNNGKPKWQILTKPLQWGRDVSIPEITGDGSITGIPYSLQWGRDISIPEISCGSRRWGARQGLQWGRDVSIPEIPWISCSRSTIISFNGAGMFPSQKCVAMRLPIADVRSASMGPGCFHPRNGSGPANTGAITISFNGAGMFPSQK